MTADTMSDPEFASEHERWAETEAKQCDRHVAYLKEHVIPGWIERVTANPHPDNARGLYEAAIRMQAWEQQADALRRPRYIRIETDAYRKHYANYESPSHDR